MSADGVRRCPRGSSFCSVISCDEPTRSAPATSSWRTSGASASTRGATWSTSMSGDCAASLPGSTSRRCAMSDTASARDGWLLPAWAVFASVNAGLMYVLPGAETIPFHFVWVSTAVAYGLRLRPWSLPVTWATCAVVTVVTGVPLLRHAASGSIGWEETSEIPLMALLFLVMVWHVRRRMAALAAARRMADAEHRAREAQRRFVRLASHELRTPITVARGFTELVCESANSAEVGDDLDVVLEELDKLEGTVARLLRLARAEDAPLDLVEVNLADLLRQTARRWAPTAPRRRFEVDCEEMWMGIDPARLAVAIDSMLENAVRHTRDGGVIRLQAIRDGEDVIFAVADDGSGIDEADLPLVFEGFHSTGPHGGTGLGLAIVKSVAQAHGGAASARNAAGGGAVIQLVLPAAYQADCSSAVEGEGERQDRGRSGQPQLASRHRHRPSGVDPVIDEQDHRVIHLADRR